jgi:hypothetical protein
MEQLQKALNLRLSGATYKQIGIELGISEPAAFKLVTREIARQAQEVREDANQVKEMEMQRLDQLTLLNAKNFTDPAKQGPAIDRALRIMERRCKLLGIDAAQKVEVSDADVENLVLSVMPILMKHLRHTQPEILADITEDFRKLVTREPIEGITPHAG